MINLQTIIDGLKMVDDMNRVFFDTETNETVYLSEFDPELTADTAELMEANPSRFIPLPEQREINEYGMMEDFIDALPDGEKKYTLVMSINGRGAFRRFKGTVRHYGLEQQWYAFRDKAYARVAVAGGIHHFLQAGPRHPPLPPGRGISETELPAVQADDEQLVPPLCSGPVRPGL